MKNLENNKSDKGVIKVCWGMQHVPKKDTTSSQLK